MHRHRRGSARCRARPAIGDEEGCGSWPRARRSAARGQRIGRHRSQQLRSTASTIRKAAVSAPPPRPLNAAPAATSHAAPRRLAPANSSHHSRLLLSATTIGHEGHAGRVGDSAGSWQSITLVASRYPSTPEGVTTSSRLLLDPSGSLREDGEAGSSALAEMLKEEVVHALGSVELHPVTGAFNAGVAPRPCHMFGRADHPVLGQVSVAAAPQPQRRSGDRGRSGLCSSSKCGARLARYQLNPAVSAPGRERSCKLRVRSPAPPPTRGGASNRRASEAPRRRR
jgi:hypothetical protein